MTYTYIKWHICTLYTLWDECGMNGWGDLCGHMNEWMNEWMNGWREEWMNKWMNGWMNEWMNNKTLLK